MPGYTAIGSLEGGIGFFSDVVRACAEVGVPISFLSRSGKPSLVLDLIEEFRTAAVDRAMLGLVNEAASSCWMKRASSTRRRAS